MHLLGVRSDELPWLLRVRLRVRTVWCRRRTLYRVLHHGVLREMFPPEVRETGFRRFGDVSTQGTSIKQWHATCLAIMLRACSITDACTNVCTTKMRPRPTRAAQRPGGRVPTEGSRVPMSTPRLLRPVSLDNSWIQSWLRFALAAFVRCNSSIFCSSIALHIRYDHPPWALHRRQGGRMSPTHCKRRVGAF